jgi:KipI family sensor histidine kinase inhibitor
MHGVSAESPTLIVESYGDAAVMVSVSHADPAARRRRIGEFRDTLLARRPPGVIDVVSGLESLLIEFDQLATATEHVEFAVRLLADLPAYAVAPRAARLFEIPIVIDDEHAPDLADVATELGVGGEDICTAIVASELTISLLAAAMAPMMDGLRVPAPVRRRATPHTNVSAGAVMIAGTNAIIQPFPGPTGWRVIGHTPLTIVDIFREQPVSFRAGDRVRFRIVPAEYAASHVGEFLEPACTFDDSEVNP